MIESNHKFWGVVELHDKKRFAGHLQEVMIAGAQMLQIEIPANGMLPEEIKYFSGAAILAIHGADQQTALHIAGQRVAHTQAIKAPAHSKHRGKNPDSLDLWSGDAVESWWATVNHLVHDGVLRDREDFLIQEGTIYLSFTQVHAAVVRDQQANNCPRERMLSEGIRWHLKKRPDFLWSGRKRMSPELNINVMAFRWGDQIDYPKTGIRKVR